MARKNNSREEGAIHFDTRTRTVMAESRQENLKEKIKAVREVVPGQNRDELVLVLQYFEYNVEKTIQAYLEDGAKKVLQEWNHMQPRQKGKNKKKEQSDYKPNNKNKDAATKTPTVTVNGTKELESNHIDNGDDAAVEKDERSLPNGRVPHDHVDSPEQTDNETPDQPFPRPSPELSSMTTTTTDKTTGPSQPQRHHQQQRNDRTRGKGPKESHGVHHNSLKQHQQRERTISERNNASSAYGGEHGHHNLDKSFKDLQRQTTSLERLKHLLDSEIDRSCKSVKKVFEEIRKGLDDRESKILAELDVVKKEASDMLDSRHAKAMDLKRMVERSERLKESEIVDVRTQIKHFVTDRRHDEEMGRTTRFMYDSDHLLSEVNKFGEVIHIPKPVVRPASSISTTTNSNNNASGKDTNHSQVDDVEERLKNSLHIQSPTSSSRQQSAPLNGSRNRGNSDKQPRGPKSPRNRRSNTPSSPASSPPPTSSSLATSSQPQTSSLQSQQPQPQRQRRPDSGRNSRGGSANANRNTSNNIDGGISNDAQGTSSDRDGNKNNNRSPNRGGRGGNRGQDRGRGSGRGRGGRGGYRGNPQQSSLGGDNSNHINTSQPVTA